MPTSKQPGQVAFEAFWEHPSSISPTWGGSTCQEQWAAVESAVRADERAKIREALANMRAILIEANFHRSVAELDKALSQPQPVAAILDKAQDPDGGEN